MKVACSPSRDLFVHRRHEAMLYVVAAYALWLVPALLALALMGAGHATTVRWSAIVLLEIVAGFGAFAVAGIAHEGLHGSLAGDRQRSALAGALLSASILGFYAPGFYVLHARHHRYVNTMRDPVAVHYTRFTGIPGRLLLARLAEGPRYFVETLRLLAPGAQRVDAFVSFDTLRRTAWLTLTVKACLWVAVVVLAIVLPQAVVSIVVAPAAVSILIASAVPFLEHAQTVDAPAIHSARSHVSRWMTVLRLGANFHLAHHLFPAIPCWRLSHVHAQLEAAEPEAIAALTDRSLADMWQTLRRREWRIAARQQ